MKRDRFEIKDSTTFQPNVSRDMTETSIHTCTAMSWWYRVSRNMTVERGLKSRLLKKFDSI